MSKKYEYLNLETPGTSMPTVKNWVSILDIHY